MLIPRSCLVDDIYAYADAAAIAMLDDDACYAFPFVVLPPISPPAVDYSPLFLRRH